MAAHGEFERFDSVIIRYGGEVGVKSPRTRRIYDRCMLRNIRNVLDYYKLPYDKIIRKYGRLYLKTSKAIEVCFRLCRIFGISSVSPAVETSSSLNEVIDKSLLLLGPRLKPGSSFAVRCRRVGVHPYTSQEVCSQVGGLLLDKFRGLGLKVNLEKPNLELGIEIREDKAYIFMETIVSVGGLPLGTQPKALALFDGSLESSVACWLFMKRGCPITLLYFDNSPFIDKATLDRVVAAAKALLEWSIGFERKIYIIPNGQNLAEFKKYNEGLVCFLCKRLMYLAAGKVADIKKCGGIVTGEVLGEEAGRTLRNLRLSTYAVKKYPIYTPLISFSKDEVEDVAKKIRIYETSLCKVKECRAFFKPKTLPCLEEAVEAERTLNIEEMANRSVSLMKVINL